MQEDYTTIDYKSQVKKILRKTILKKEQNKKIVKWLNAEHKDDTALRVSHCASSIGITDIDGVARVVRADFCRERICAVCAWRRQSRFVAQTTPVIQYMTEHGYKFLFATLTIKSVTYNSLECSIDLLMRAFAALRHRKEIKQSWSGIIRSLELTINSENKTFHPHIHMLIAVKDNYFDSCYITQQRLSEIWKECLNVDYVPVVDIRTVDDNGAATVEVLKYSLKPTDDTLAYSAFYYIMRNRRLISFTGIFKKLRSDFKYSDFERVLTDDIPTGRHINYSLYRLDCTGGVYTYFKDKEFEL